MKKLLLAFLLIFPVLAHAQAIPEMDRRVTLAGPTGLNAALHTKADVQNGTLYGASLDNASTWGETTWAMLNNAIACLTTPQCIISTTIKYSPTWAKSTERSLEARLMDQVSVLDFDQVAGNGSHDATPALQGAINAICSAPGGSAPWGSGGRIYFPPGVYNISSVTFPCNGITLDGANNGNVNSGYLDYRGTVIHLTTAANTSAFTSGSVSSDYGGGIQVKNMGIDGTDMASSSTVFDYSWLQHSVVRNISAYNIQNFFREEGGAANTIEDVVILGLSGTGIEFFGDASECGTKLSSCNKRADLLRVNRVNMNGASGHTATCYAYHDFAQSLDVTNSVCESAKFGINAYCQASQGNNGEACPAFARFYDFEAEDCTTCVNASDVQDWEFFGGYFLGQGAASTHVVNMFSTNFGGNPTNTSIGPYAQAIRFHGGRFGNAGSSVMFIGISHFIVESAQFFMSNLSDTDNSVGAPNIEVSGTGTGTMPERGSIHDNILCTASGQQPIANPNNSSLSYMQGGIWLDAGVNYIKVHDNVTVGCTGKTSDQGNGVTDNSGKTGNDIHNN